MVARFEEWMFAKRNENSWVLAVHFYPLLYGELSVVDYQRTVCDKTDIIKNERMMSECVLHTTVSNWYRSSTLMRAELQKKYLKKEWMDKEEGE